MIKHEQSQHSSLTAKVKWFHRRKGFGFLEDPHGRGDIFVHHSAIEADGYRLLRDGELVEVELELEAPARDRLRARTVRRLA